MLLSYVDFNNQFTPNNYEFPYELHLCVLLWVEERGINDASRKKLLGSNSQFTYNYSFNINSESIN